VGIAKEATKGTWVTPSATIGLDTFDPVDNITELPVTGMRGSMGTDYGMVPGIGHSDISCGGPVYPDTIGWFLAGVGGDLAVTGSAAPYTNVISLLNSGQGQPSSHSLTDVYGATQARAYTAVQWSEVALNFAAPSLLSFTAKGMGLLSTQETAPTPSFTTVMPFPVWQFQATINSITTLFVTKATVTITRKSTVIPQLNATQTPAQLFLGPISSVAWKFTVLGDASDTALGYYLNGTQIPLDLTASYGTSGAAVELDVHSTDVALTSAPIKTENDYITFDCSGTAIMNSTDAGTSGGTSPFKITLKNAVDGAYV
jgi:hypothetical protein